MKNIYIGIGSNLGDREKNIRQSINFLKEKCTILKASSLYETEPIGYKKQRWFLNCAVKIETKLIPLKLLEFLQSIEKRLKRAKKIKNGPRTIDLDIIFYDKKIINEKANGNSLIVPHPRMHERLFVLVPLYEINPKLKHPLLKKSIKDLMEKLEGQQILNMHKNNKIFTK